MKRRRDADEVARWNHQSKPTGERRFPLVCDGSIAGYFVRLAASGGITNITSDEGSVSPDPANSQIPTISTRPARWLTSTALAVTSRAPCA